MHKNDEYFKDGQYNSNGSDQFEVTSFGISPILNISTKGPKMELQEFDVSIDHEEGKITRFKPSKINSAIQGSTGMQQTGSSSITPLEPLSPKLTSMKNQEASASYTDMNQQLTQTQHRSKSTIQYPNNRSTKGELKNQQSFSS